MASIGDMGDARFRAQYRTIQEAMRRGGFEIAAEPYTEYDVHYIYVEDRLLVRTAFVERVQEVLKGGRVIEPDEDRPQLDGLRVLSTDELSVPEALRRLDAADLGGEEGTIVYSPDHVMSVAGICMCGAIEPERPCCGPPDAPLADCGPCPPRRESAGGRPVRLGVADTGFNADPPFDWLAGINEDQPDLGVGAQIDFEGGHGRFVAGVSRCVAPDTELRVVNAFPYAGATAESDAVARIGTLLDGFRPEILNVSAGTHTYHDTGSLGFLVLSEERLGDTLLVAAAGNDSSDRPFYPAAFPWAVSVGALATDWEHHAWFTNFGDWVDVYAPGESLVNAYHVGRYAYHEPPRTGAVQNFAGLARWSGTSFAAPYVAGLIAREMAGTGAAPRQAWAQLGGGGGAPVVLT